MMSKKKKIITSLVISLSCISIIVLVISSLFFLKLLSKSNVKNVELIYYEDAIVQDINDIRIDLFYLDIHYENNDVERKVCSKNMVSFYDLLKLKEEGMHNITISYESYKFDVNIYIYDSTHQLENDIYIYSNTDKLEVIANIDEYTPTKEGWYFNGWYLDEAYTTAFETNNDQTPGVRKLFAFWSKEPVYKVKFMLDENTCLKEEKVIKGGNATPPAVNSYNELIFIGWDKSFENITSDLVVYALFKAPLYEVTFLDINNNVISKYMVEKGASIIPPTAPIVDGFEFVGWSQETNNIKSNIIVKSIYKSIVTVYYYDSDLETIIDIKNTLEQPIPPTKTGFRFDEWVEIPSNQKNAKTYYATYKELESKLTIFLEDQYITSDLVTKTYLDLYIDLENIKFINIDNEEISFDRYGNSVDNTYTNYLLDTSSISKLTGIYGTYEYYLDEAKQNKIDLKTFISNIQSDETNLYNDYCLYGKKTSKYEIDENLWEYTLDLESDTYHISYVGKQYTSEKVYEIAVPNTYNNKKVTVIESLKVPYQAVCYIGENIEKINLKSTNVCSGFIVSKSNPNYESYCGILLDINKNSVAKMCIDTEKTYGLFALNKNCIDDLFNNQDRIKNELKTTYDTLDSYSFQDYFKIGNRKYDNSIIFKDNIKIYSDTFIQTFSYYPINISFENSFTLLDNDIIDFENTNIIKITFTKECNTKEELNNYILNIFNQTDKIINNKSYYLITIKNINLTDTSDLEDIINQIENYYKDKYKKIVNISLENSSLNISIDN